MRAVFFSLLILSLVFSGCASSQGGQRCSSDDECVVPMEYLVRSDCPYGAACIDGLCEVVCPLPVVDEQGMADWSDGSSCERDRDCGCDRPDARECLCLEGTCVAVMERAG